MQAASAPGSLSSPLRCPRRSLPFGRKAPASHAIGLSRLRCAVVKVRDEQCSSGNLEDDTVLRSAFSHPDPPRSPAPVVPCGSGISAGLTLSCLACQPCGSMHSFMRLVFQLFA